MPNCNVIMMNSLSSHRASARGASHALYQFAGLTCRGGYGKTLNHSRTRLNVYSSLAHLLSQIDTIALRKFGEHCLILELIIGNGDRLDLKELLDSKR